MQKSILTLIFIIFYIHNLATATENRYALVVGNAAYPSAPLDNPVNDATDMATKLKERGFEVTQISDATQEQMEAAIETFTRALSNRDTVGLFYYAGHGLEVGGENYLVPIDAKLRAEADVKYKTVNAGLLLDRMAKAGNGLNLVILDACRNNPFKRGWRGVAGINTDGLAQMQPAAGTLILYATEPHKQASDGDGRNGTFTKHLLAALDMPGVQVEDAFKQVSEQVMTETGKQQIPWFEGVIHGRFYFIAPSTEPIKLRAEVQPPAESLEQAYWQSTEKCGKLKCFKAYLKKYPHGEFVDLAEAQLADSLPAPGSKPTPVAEEPIVEETSSPKKPDTILQNSYLLDIELIAKTWNEYKQLVNNIESLASNHQYVEIKNEIDSKTAIWDEYVIKISKELKKFYPESTIVFYGLPISITSTKYGSKESKEWSSQYSTDHWVIANDKNLWIAWRQESAYFYQIMDHKKNKDGYATTLKKGDEVINALHEQTQ